MGRKCSRFPLFLSRRKSPHPGGENCCPLAGRQPQPANAASTPRHAMEEKGVAGGPGILPPQEGSPQDVRPFQWSQPGEAGAKDQRTQEEGICTASSWHQNSSPLPPCSQASWDEGTTRTMSVGTTARLLTFVFGAMCSVSFLYKRPLRYQQSVGLLNQGTVHKPEEKKQACCNQCSVTSL